MASMLSKITQKSKLLFIINAIISVVFITASSIIVIIAYSNAKNEALIAAREKAAIILNRNLATHAYLNQQLKPVLLKFTKDIRTDYYFSPVWMSSTYAIREINRLNRDSRFEKNYYYKEAAINARSPGNEADSFERDFIVKLNSDPGLSELSQVRYLNKAPYFVFMRRGEAMEKECLMCHDTPGRAPAGMVAIYGPDRSFNRTVGETVSALSLRIPLEDAYSRAGTQVVNLLKGIVPVLLIVFAMQYVVTNRLMMINNSLNTEINARAITEEKLRRTVDEKEVLMREIHHRVKNNLAVAESLIHLQCRKITDEHSKEKFKEVQGRLESMRMLHEHLYRSHQYAAIELGGYLNALADQLLGNYDARGRIVLEVDSRDQEIVVEKAMHCGLIVNELLTNALKYAFPDGRKGKISISVSRDESGRWTVSVRDDGIGLPDDFDADNAATFGFTIVKALLRTLHGTLSVSPGSGPGTEITITFADDSAVV